MVLSLVDQNHVTPDTAWPEADCARAVSRTLSPLGMLEVSGVTMTWAIEPEGAVDPLPHAITPAAKRPDSHGALTPPRYCKLRSASTAPVRRAIAWVSRCIRAGPPSLVVPTSRS